MTHIANVSIGVYLNKNKFPKCLGVMSCRGREPCAPGRSNHVRSACAVRVQTKAAPAWEPYKPLKGRKTLTENHWPTRLWGMIYHLQAIFDTYNRHDLVIVMGDLSAEVGEDNKDMKGIIGKHGLGNINDNGQNKVQRQTVQQICSIRG